jgi:plastocyanin
MQLFGRALIASAVVLAACAGAGGESAPADSTTVVASNAAMAPAPAATQAAEPAAAVTGQTHDVQMVLDNGQYKYVPDKITAKEGDAIKFINVSGGPHNVQFKEENVPDDMEAQLANNMPAGAMAKLGPLSGPLLMQPNESYTVSFVGIKPGEYPFTCTPHEAMGMNGSVTVQ